MKKMILLILAFLLSISAYSSNEFEESFTAQYSEIYKNFKEFDLKKDSLTTMLFFDASSNKAEVQAEIRTLEIEYMMANLIPLVRRYAWAIPNDQAIKAMSKYGPIIEIGAGSGYWAKLLSNHGVDIVAFDNGSYDSSPVYSATTQWFNVKNGTERAVLDYQERTLFLCWPPLENQYPLASKTLELYEGLHLIYVGEVRGGRSGDLKFFDLLDRQFDLIETVSIPQWPGYADELRIYRRKPPTLLSSGSCTVQ